MKQCWIFQWPCCVQFFYFQSPLFVAPSQSLYKSAMEPEQTLAIYSNCTAEHKLFEWPHVCACSQIKVSILAMCCKQRKVRKRSSGTVHFVCVSFDWNEHIHQGAQIKFIGVKFVKGLAQERKLVQHLIPPLHETTLWQASCKLFGANS